MYTHIHGASLDFRNRVIHQALHDASCHPKEKEKAFRFVRQLQKITQATAHSSFVTTSPSVQTRSWTFTIFDKLLQTAARNCTLRLKRSPQYSMFLLAPELCGWYLSGYGHVCKQSTSTREGEQRERWLLY